MRALKVMGLGAILAFSVGACDKASKQQDGVKVDKAEEPAKQAAAETPEKATEAPTNEATVGKAGANAAEPVATATAAPNEAAKAAPANSEDGCIYTEEEKKNSTATIARVASGHFGSPFTLKAAKPVSEALSGIQETTDDVVQVSGEVAAVCQKKGCWLVVTDGKEKARIKMKDYAFTIPIDSKGKKAVVEGTVSVKKLTEAQVKHLEEDAGRDPSKVEGPRNEYIMVATGIEIEG